MPRHHPALEDAIRETAAILAGAYLRLRFCDPAQSLSRRNLEAAPRGLKHHDPAQKEVDSAETESLRMTVAGG